MLDNIKRSGFVRARIDGSIYELAEEEVTLDKNNIEIPFPTNMINTNF